MRPVILASQSPRRKTLLEWAEIPFEIIVQPTDESFPDGMRVEDVPVHIAINKARAIVQPGRIVVAADTVVVLDETVIGKPAGREEAVDTLARLSGRVHRVITGVVVKEDEREEAFSDVTEVEFHELSDNDIRFYVDKYAPYDKAGAYAIQEWIGVRGIRRVSGDFYNVMGLPVNRLVQVLRRWDAASGG